MQTPRRRRGRVPGVREQTAAEENKTGRLFPRVVWQQNPGVVLPARCSRDRRAEAQAIGWAGGSIIVLEPQNNPGATTGSMSAARGQGEPHVKAEALAGAPRGG